MKRLTPLALTLSFAFSAALPAHAETSAFGRSTGVDVSLAAGLDMMLLNASLLRNGDNVWERLREGFQLPEVNPEIVRRHEQQMAARPESFKRSLDRSRKYLFHILNEVERRGMPTELALLPMVESSFVPTAVSPVGAAGLWQFMPATGRQYGLEQTWWYDGRRDVVDATRAALDYLQNLYTLFGDWNLALAAYNWGEGNVSRAIARLQASGQEVTYEALKMPNETRNYAPKLLAVRNLLMAPEKYGLKLDKFPNKPYFVALSTGRHMDIDVAAKLAGMSVSEFKELNPAFNLPVYAHKSGRQMLIPANKIDQFEKNLSEWNKPLLTWQVYTPAGDENAVEVASRYGMSTEEFAAVNKLNRTPTLTAGRPVLVAMKSGASSLVPDAAEPAPTAPVLVADSRPPVIVAERAPMVSQPVTVASAAPVAAPRTAAPAAPAVTLAVAKPAVSLAAAVPSAPPPATVIQPPKPDTTPAIVAEAAPVAATPAISSDVSVSRAATAPTVSAPAQPVRVAEIRPAAPVSAAVNPNAREHTVAAGDTLFNISRRYNLTVAELKALNGMDENVLKLGQVLRVKASGSSYAMATPVATPTAPARQMVNAEPASARDEALLKVAGLSTSGSATGQVPSEYVVQRGDTVFSIARKFGLHHTDIQRWNDSSLLARLQPGQRVRIQGL